MDFDRKKESILSKMREADRSKKGGIDDDIRDVLDMLNKHPDYATTSSCSGRIVLLDLRERRKDVNEWLLSKHAPVTEIEWNTAMEKEKKGIVWLKQEPSILHVSCRNDAAIKRFILLAQEAGYKQIGIISRPRNIVEIMGSEMMSVPVWDKKGLIDENYKRYLILEANRKLSVAKAQLQAFENILKNNL